MSKKVLAQTLAVSLAALANSASGALVAWWPFNNSPNDQVGALNWTLTGGATYLADCKEGSASLLCDGVDDRATLTGSGLMSAVFSTKTVALWFKANSTTKTQVIYDEGGGSNGWSIHLENDALEAAVCASSVKAILSTPFSSPKWSHVAISFDNGVFKLYLNGKEVASTTTSFTSVPSHTNASGLGATNAGNAFIGATSGDNFGGLIDDVRMYDQALSAAEIRGLCGDVALAAVVSPENGATDVPRDAPLTWTAGETAGTHDVYFGTTFADVNTATRANAKGVLAGQGQTQTTYAPAGLLAYGQTYYWRIDEVNGVPDNTIFKGDVCSFTVEPYGYPVTPVAATASSFQPGMEPTKTIDGSGLTGGLHGTEPTTMWMSVGTGANWIQYEFEQVYKLDQLVVWNSNQAIEAFFGFGAKDVTIEYSVDGATWSTLASVPPFARATGAAGYAANTTVDFGGVEAKFVKLTINSNWGGVAPQAGLSEVQFSYIPVRAREPMPADGAAEVSVDAELNWRPGREATSHKVFFGTDSAAVADETAAAQTVTEHSFLPAALNFGTTYYWKVNEVGAATYPGDVWSFTAQEYVPIDDFESYTDQPGEEIFMAWIDGFTTGLSGSTVGYLTASGGTFGETTVIHGGKQSMPLQYDNSVAPFVSEAERTFDTAQNWTGNGADSLVVNFRGLAPAFAETVSGGILMNAIGTDIWSTSDQFRYAYKSLTGDGSIVARVDSLIRANAWSKAGVMIRESLDAGSRHVGVVVTPDNGVSFLNRPDTGQASVQVNQTGPTAPYWVKLTRKGNVFSAARSDDGVTWVDVSATATPVTVTMTAPTVYIGLALTSHDAAIETSAAFSNIATTGNVSGSWQVAEIGAVQPEGNSVEGLYLTVKDSSGKTKTVQHPDPAATAYVAWQTWRIPLSDFTSAGVKMTAVKSLTLGAGNRAAPQAGGTGTMYIDDIGFGHPAQ